jgi:hypothetical protein
MMRTLRSAAYALTLMAVTLLLAGCSGILGPREDDTLRELLNTREAMWQQKGFPSYTMSVMRIAHDTPSLREVVLHVQAGQIQSAEYADTGEPLSAAARAEYLTVQGMFNLIRDALGRTIASISVNYDPEYGFPTEILIDYDVRRNTDDIYFGVSELTATP